MLLLDLCCGLGGASAGFRSLGWDVLTLDIQPAFNPDFVADVRSWSYPAHLPFPDVVWASPPCVEFSRADLPFYRDSASPDMSIVFGCLDVIFSLSPRFWVLENVRGAIPFFRPFLGSPRASFRPYFFWGFFPDVGSPSSISWRSKESVAGSSCRSAVRAVIPFSLSRSFALACMGQRVLL